MPPVKKTGAKEDVVLKKEDDELLMDLTMDSVNGETNLKYSIFKLNKEESEVEDISDTKGEEIVAASSTTLILDLRHQYEGGPPPLHPDQPLPC